MTAPPAARRGHLVDLRPLRESPAFARMWAGAAVTGIGSQMTIVAVGLDIYDRTASTLAVSLVAAFALGPMIIFGLYGGALADRFDRRMVALVAAIAAWVSTAAIALYSWLGVPDIWPLYVFITVNSVAAVMVQVARSAMVPRLVRLELLPAAGALGGISAGVQLTVGPALAGLLVAYLGFSATYTVDVVLFLAAFYGLYTLPSLIPDGERRRADLRSIVEGWTFLRVAPNIRASFVLDIVAMTFGNPRVLFPAIGALLIGGGAVTVGILSSAGAVGMLVLGLLSGRVAAVRAHGKGMVIAVAAYGGSILLFGVLLLATTVLPIDVGTDITEANIPATRHRLGAARRLGRGRLGQHDLSHDHDSGRGARRHARALAGALHRRGQRRAPHRRPLRRCAQPHRALVVSAPARRAHHHRHQRGVLAHLRQPARLRRSRPPALSTALLNNAAA